MCDLAEGLHLLREDVRIRVLPMSWNAHRKAKGVDARETLPAPGTRSRPPFLSVDSERCRKLPCAISHSETGRKTRLLLRLVPWVLLVIRDEHVPQGLSSRLIPGDMFQDPHSPGEAWNHGERPTLRIPCFPLYANSHGKVYFVN